MVLPSQITKVYGVDFSGARDAGRHIWISTGIIEGINLRITQCARADSFLTSSVDREECLAALRNFIANERDCAFGLDFPFGLPREPGKKYDSWEGFLHTFPSRYATAEAFNKLCHSRSGDKREELKRQTDKETHTPFSPYNLRLYKQTYYGVRDLLGPLAQEGQACVLPMQAPRQGTPWVLEVCPASSLKKRTLPYQGYKGRNIDHYGKRKDILHALVTKGGLCIGDNAIRSTVLDNLQGDALDSVIAALATFAAIRNPVNLQTSNRVYMIEGYVYL